MVSDRTEYVRQYRLLNKDKIALNRAKHKDSTHQRRREHHECPCGGSYSVRNKSRHMKSSIHQAYEGHVLIPELKIKCSCGGSYTKRSMNEHIRTKRHQTYLHPSPKPSVKPRFTVPVYSIVWIEEDCTKVNPPPLC